MSAEKVTYVMPKVSVIMRDSGKLSTGMSYDYGHLIAKKKKSTINTVLNGIFGFIGFALGLSLFVLSVSLTSYMLVTASNSPVVLQMRTQDVPSDGIVRDYYVEKKLVKSAED